MKLIKGNKNVDHTKYCKLAQVFTLEWTVFVNFVPSDSKTSRGQI
jgi:hypothetical protein